MIGGSGEGRGTGIGWGGQFGSAAPNDSRKSCSFCIQNHHGSAGPSEMGIHFTKDTCFNPMLIP